MSEEDIITRTGSLPATVGSLVADLAALGVRPGMTLLVHSALSALGWVSGGPQAVVLALEQSLGPEGTLVMPAHSGGLSDPANWHHPPVPAAWWQIIRDTMPAFDPDLTPTRSMGAVVECFRKQAGVRRSYHPQVSFVARGPHADFITRDHALAFSLGEGSPLARVYDLDGWILLLGVGHGNNTSLHLAEYRANFTGKQVTPQGAPILVDGRREWVEFDDIDLNDEDFPAIGAAFARDTGLQHTGQVAAGQAILVPQRALVDYVVGWMSQNRQPPAAVS
jgi:aminoglycoside 3-N-acetyltransferase